MPSGLRQTVLCGAILLGTLAAGCDRQAQPQGRQPTSSTRAATAAVGDKALTAQQSQLLDIAFETASAIPAAPHIKDRCKMQEAVVVACLKLEQPLRAGRYAQQIADWRRGLVFADLAMYHAQRGQADAVNNYLVLAEEVAKTAEDWRQDRIRVRIAQVHAWQGQAEKAAQLEAGVDASEQAKVARVQAQRASDESFDEQLKSLQACLATGIFDVMKNTLESSVALADRFYGDAARRQAVEKMIADYSPKMPLLIRIDLLMELARVSLRHDDGPAALSRVNEAQTLFEGATWPVEFGVSVAARLGLLRHQAGDTAKARVNVDAAAALFEAQHEKIVNIDRAEALIPLAEAYQAMGDAPAARRTYGWAIEHGTVNPNSRPRAEDLTAVCLSMAVHAVEPDTALMTKIRQVRDGLGTPW